MRMFRKDSVEECLKEGHECLKKRDVMNAKDAYLKALSIDPDNTTALNNLSQIYAMLSDVDKSRGYSEILLLKCDEKLKKAKSEKILMLKSNAQIALESYDEANETFDEILKINPKNIITLFQKSQYHESKNQIGEALRYVDAVLKINEHDLPANLSKARLLTKLEEYDEANEHLSLVFKIDPKNKAAMNLKAKLIKEKNNTTISAHDFMIKAMNFWEMEEFDKSLAYFDKALDLDSSHDEIWYLRGELLIRMGQIANAISSFKTAFKLNPESGGIVKKREFFRLLNAMKKLNTILGFEK